jgi:subtilisin family serine protease
MAHEANRSVLDPELRSLFRQARPTDDGLAAVSLAEVAAMRTVAEPPAAIAARVGLKLLVEGGRRGDAEAWVRQAGGEVVSSAGAVLVADLPPEALPGLDDTPWARRAEAARQLLPRLDEARGPASGLDAAVAGLDSPLTGDGVVVGIVDSGVDWRHPDFQDDDGDTRLELFAHARRPNGVMTSTYEEFAAGLIDDALAGHNQVPLGDPNGHGTHCASIAVGNGRVSGGRFRGVATGASLVAVRSEPLLDTHTIWGIRRTFELAGDRPAVVSLSLGGHLGPHDGTTAIENVIARESGPGRIVVVAAGNEGGDRIHWQGDLVAGEELAIPVRIGDPRLQFVDVWVPRGDDVEVAVETPDGVRHEPDGEQVDTVFGLFEAHWAEDPVNRDRNLTLFVAGGRVNHVWNLRLTARTVVHGEVHAWAGTANPSTSAQLFPGVTDDRYSIGMPATEERSLAVGSFVSRNRFETAAGVLAANGLEVGSLSPFSSQGPSRYGAFKPDVAAPGQYVTAALAAGSEMATDPRYTPRHDPSGRYITIQGTSMATPFVAGVVALLLEREPRLTPEEIQQRLRISCRRDAQTTRVWHPGFGFGKIDVEALLGVSS